MKGLGIRERLANWLLLPSQTTKEDAIIVPNYRVAIGEFQPENIRSAIDAYIHDTDIFNAVNFISNSALSPGFYVTGDQDYKSGKAIDLIEDFNRTIRWGNRRSERGLPELLRIITKEMLYGGNTFIEMLTPDRLQALNQVELSSIYRIYRSEQGDINKIQQLIGGTFNDLDPDTIIHIPWLQIDREPFGRGLIQPLIAPRTDVKGKQIPPLYKIKASLEYDVWRMVHRKGVPRSVFSFPEAGDELIQDYAKELKDPDVDSSVTTNAKVVVATETGGPAAGIAPLIEFMDKRYQAGLQTPINNILNASGYTEASSRTAKELGGLIVTDVQMRLAHSIYYEMYERVLIQNNYDPAQADIKLHWGAQEEADYTLADLAQMFDRALVTVTEARMILRRIGWELEDDSALSQAPATATVGKSQQVAINAPAGSVPITGLIGNALQPQMQAAAQGFAPGQVGPENPRTGNKASGGTVS